MERHFKHTLCIGHVYYIHDDMQDGINICFQDLKRNISAFLPLFFLGSFDTPSFFFLGKCEKFSQRNKP